MKTALDLKNKGEAEKKPASRGISNLLGNGTYGQTLKRDHDNNVQFINIIEDKNKFY